jgi:acetyl esterase/lipase
MQLLRVLQMRWRGARLAGDSPHELRHAFRRDNLAIAGPPIAVGTVNDLAIDGAGGVLRARHYAPAGGRPRPLMVYFHGGGFVVGDLDSYDALCRRLCRDADICILSIDYRLAPEHRFPAAVDDALAAFRWAADNAERLGAIPGKVAVGGDSAGGNLAAVVSYKSTTQDGPVPCAQLLLYPAVDRTTSWGSLTQFSDGFILTRDDIDWFHLQYTGTSVARPEPAQNPLCAKEFSRLPPTLMAVAGFDPLHDEGVAYAKALRDAGVPVVLRQFEGLLHGFCSMAGISTACRQAVAEVAGDLRTMLDPPTATARR